MVSATRVPNNRATFEGAIGSVGVSRVEDRLITPTAHYLASSGIGSARLQFSCSPCLADLWTASAEAVDTDVTMYGPLSPSTSPAAFHALPGWRGPYSVTYRNTM